MKKSRVVILGILLFFSLVLAMYSQNYFSLPGEHATEIDEPYGDTVITLNDYKVYDLVDVPFRFILANFKISNIRPISFDLSRFQSDDGIQLNLIDEYRSEISRKGYDLSIQNVTTQLSSNENELNATILIPVKNIYRKTLRVNISGVKTNVFTFDLNNPTGKAEELGKTVQINPDTIDSPSENEPTVEPTPTEVEISNTTQFLSATLISKDLILYKGLQSYHRVDFGDNVRILLVSVSFDYDHDVSITAARLNFVETDDLFFALGPEYVNENGNNILNKLVRQETGSLIFQIDDRIYDVLNQPYNVEVRFAGSDDWVILPMNQETGY